MEEALFRLVNKPEKKKETDKDNLAIKTYQNAIAYFVIFKNYTENYTPTIEFRDLTVSMGAAYAVISSFAIELFIKAILYKKNIKFGTTHKIEELIKLLPKDVRENLKKIDYWFKRKLLEISDTFVYFRYINEVSSGYLIDFPFLQKLMIRLESISYEIVLGTQ